MEKNDIEYIFISESVATSSFHPMGARFSTRTPNRQVGGYDIIIIWKNSDDIFFEFNIKISDEFRQDLGGVYKDNPDILKDLIIDNPKNNKEVSLECLQKRYKQYASKQSSKYVTWPEELNKKLIPYIRNEKLNKLLN